MKHMHYFNLLAAVILVVSWACSSNPSTTPSTTSSGSSAAVTVSAVMNSSAPYDYSYATGGSVVSQPITITHGQSILFDSSNSGHPLYLYDSTDTTCLATGSTSFPLTETFSTVGTYYFHCGLHSNCMTTCAGSSCNGMAATVVAQ